MALGDKYPVLMSSQLGTPNGPAALNADSLLPILQGGTLAGNPQLALANLGAGVRPNLLDNPYFVGGGSQQGSGQLPINQQGQTSYTNDTATFTYCIDRWMLRRGVISVNDKGITISNSATQVSPIFEQIIENKNPGIYTVSFLTQYGLYDFTFDYLATGGTESYTKDIVINGEQWQILSGAASDTSYNLYISIKANSSTITPLTIFAVKLEKGDSQTLAYQDSIGAWKLIPQTDMDYGTQLAKCQQHKIAYPGSVNIPISLFTANIFWGTVWLPVPLRTSPVLQGGNIGIYNNGADVTTQISGFVFEYFQKGNLLLIKATKSAHGLTPLTASMQMNNAVLSADL